MPPLFSNVSSQIRAILQDQSVKQNFLTLRPGQVIHGKIKEILPNNVAVIQFGENQLIAKLEVPITVDQAYLFEVISVEEMPQLKIISQQGSQGPLIDEMLLSLEKIGVNPTKETKQFVQEIINRQIPVKQTELKQALILLKSNTSPAAKEMLMMMLKEQLPMSQTTLDSMTALESSKGLIAQIKNVVHGLENQPNQTESVQQLEKQLTLILNRLAADEPKTVMNEKQPSTSSAIQESVSNQQSNVAANDVQKQPAMVSESSLPLTKETAQRQLSNQIALSDKQLFQIKKVLTNIVQQQHQPTANNVEQLHTLLKDNTTLMKVSHHLPKQAVTALTEFIQEPTVEKLPEFIRPLNELIEHQFTRENSGQAFHLLSRHSQSESVLFPIRDQFLVHMRNYLLNSGLDFEHQLSKNVEQLIEQPISLKQLLLQVYSEQSIQSREIENLLNLLTGQQLSLLSEDVNFLNLSTFIPGFLGLEEDIEIEFYSRKDQDGKIDANYCRIAFYLELDQLGVTMIDMSVQNRVVHLIVYNDEDISDQLDQYKTLLKEGLAKFNYHLSTVSYKPTPDNDEGIALKTEKTPQSIITGNLDVRI